MATKANRIAERKATILAAGYAPAVAGALAHIEHEQIRRRITKGLAGTGISDGPPRAHLVKLTAWHLNQATYPTAPKSLRAIDIQIIEARARELAEQIIPADQRGRR